MYSYKLAKSASERVREKIPKVLEQLQSDFRGIIGIEK